VVVATHNLALGVIVGVIVSMVLFARKAAVHADLTSVLDPEGGTRVYSVNGELFFASTGELVGRFDYAEKGLTKAVIDMSKAHVWDSSAVAALDQVTEHFRRHGVEVEIIGLNEPSANLHQELSGTLSGGH
jgi:SulP family sulfate permease